MDVIMLPLSGVGFSVITILNWEYILQEILQSKRSRAHLIAISWHNRDRFDFDVTPFKEK